VRTLKKRIQLILSIGHLIGYPKQINNDIRIGFRAFPAQLKPPSVQENHGLNQLNLLPAIEFTFTARLIAPVYRKLARGLNAGVRQDQIQTIHV
jgi:hypothetical protein